MFNEEKSSKVEIPEKKRKKIEYQFHYDIVCKVKKHKTPDLLIMNLDQTPSYSLRKGVTTLKYMGITIRER